MVIHTSLYRRLAPPLVRFVRYKFYGSFFSTEDRESAAAGGTFVCRLAGILRAGFARLRPAEFRLCDHYADSGIEPILDHVCVAGRGRSGSNVSIARGFGRWSGSGHHHCPVGAGFRQRKRGGIFAGQSAAWAGWPGYRSRGHGFADNVGTNVDLC